MKGCLTVQDPRKQSSWAWNKQNALFEKEIKALRANNEELAAREQEYREELKKFLANNNQLKDSIEETKHQARRQAEDFRREKKQSDEKSKELNAALNNEKVKRAEEAKRMKSMISRYTRFIFNFINVVTTKRSLNLKLVRKS